MNTTQKLRALILASVLAGGFARGGEPAPAAPDVQAMLMLLNQLASDGAAEPAPTAEAAPKLPAAPRAAAPADAKPAATPAPSLLRTSSLSASVLAPSTSLSGRGSSLGQRLNDDDWHLLFHVRTTTQK